MSVSLQPNTDCHHRSRLLGRFWCRFWSRFSAPTPTWREQELRLLPNAPPLMVGVIPKYGEENKKTKQEALWWVPSPCGVFGPTRGWKTPSKHFKVTLKALEEDEEGRGA